MAGNATSWHNWAGTEAVTPREIMTPRTPGQVAEAVRRAADQNLAVRMTGSGHSFTGAAITDGIMLRPGGMAGIRSVDTAAGLVTAQAGCLLSDLNADLARRGLALANMGDIQVQTVAGAIQTGTHGTGRDLGGMATQVAALEMVLADGTIVTCSETEQPELFAAARVGLGALGVLTAVTFRVVPAFLLAAREEPMPWDEVISRLDELSAANEHFEFFWFPHTGTCLTKRNNRVPGPAQPLSRFRYRLDDEFLSNTLFGAICRLGHLAPAVIKPANRLASRALGARGYTDASYQVFTSPRRVRFKEQEYAVPREALPSVLADLRALITRRDWPISFPIEVRVTPADDVWLSTAHGRASAYIALHVYHASPHQDYFRETEAVLVAAGGRPHWGKMHSRGAAALAASYPMFGAFTGLRDKLDPDRRFRNPYLSRVLGP